MEMPQKVKGLLCKYGDLSVNFPSTPVKAGHSGVLSVTSILLSCGGEK